MNETLLKLYQHSPYILRTWAASLRGYQLKSWRYGPQTDAQVNEALEREQWSSDQWKQWQEERLAYLLERAAKRVPFYRQHWEQRRQQGDHSSWEVLSNWPVLKKESLRQNPHAFVAEDCRTNTMFHEHTSGTTGTPLDLWWSRDTVLAWYALYEARARRWYGVSRKVRWGMLGGQLVTPIEQTRPPFWVWNESLQQLYLSSYHLNQANIPAYLDALQKYRIQYLLGYTSSLDVLSYGILAQKMENIRLKVVVTNAEPLYEYQRARIEKAFGCPVRETYGMAELAAAASECPAGRMHIWPEAGFIEILNPNSQRPANRGEAGALVCTGLINPDMPLIRYEVGDRGAFSPNGDTCPCGRSLPILTGVEGRLDDVLYTRDGRQIGRLDPIFKKTMPLREAQIIQESLEEITVRYVPAPGFRDETAHSIISGLQARMGRVVVHLEEVETIPRQPNGKLRAVICLLPEDVKTQFQQGK